MQKNVRSTWKLRDPEYDLALPPHISARLYLTLHFFNCCKSSSVWGASLWERCFLLNNSHFPAIMFRGRAWQKKTEKTKTVLGIAGSWWGSSEWQRGSWTWRGIKFGHLHKNKTLYPISVSQHPACYYNQLSSPYVFVPMYDASFTFSLGLRGFLSSSMGKRNPKIKSPLGTCISKHLALTQEICWKTLMFKSPTGRTWQCLSAGCLTYKTTQTLPGEYII